MEDEPWDGDAERFATPGIKTISDLAETFDFAPENRQVKSLLYMIGDDPVLLLLRGDHELMEQKLIDALETFEARPANEDEIVAALGAHAGSLGAVGLEGFRIIADPALQARTNMTTGANVDGWHLRGVDVERDIAVDTWLDLKLVTGGEGCPECGEPLEVKRAIEVGHIFKLGTKFSEALGISVTDEKGDDRVVWMGSYGIGVGRSMAAIVESSFDESGIVWPISVAPYEAVITVVKMDDGATVATANTLYEDLRSEGVDVIIDDREERVGVKFADVELIGIPYRITVGPRGISDGTVEVLGRSAGVDESILISDAAASVAARIRRDRGE